MPFMGPYPFVIAIAALVLLTAFLAGFLIVRSKSHRQDLAEELDQKRLKNKEIAALSAELKTLKTELVRKGEIAEKLPQIAKKMTEKLPPDAYPAVAVRSIKEFFHAGKVGYFAPAENSSDYTLVLGVGFPPDWPGKVRIPSKEGILGMALEKKIVVSRVDLHSSSGWGSPGRSLQDIEVAPDFVAPVLGISGILGVLIVTDCPFLLEEERIYVSMLADLLSMALQNATHLDPSRDGKWVDLLTGVSNRMFFQQRFENEIRRAENYRQALALCMLDIDKFKEINDTHGHHAGDVVIKKMAEIVRNNTRGSDLVGRYGGDVFMVLITSTTVEQATSIMENLREKISSTGIAIPGTEAPIRITISGGLALFPTHGRSTPELFRAADEALYESKRQGRNRILLGTSAGMSSLIAKGADADRETPTPPEISTDTGSEAVEFTLGKLDEDLNP